MADATLEKGVSKEGSQGDTETSIVRTQEEIDAELRSDLNPANRVREEAARKYNETRRQALGLTEEVVREEVDDPDAAGAPELETPRNPERERESPPGEASAPGAPPLPVYLKDGEYYTKLKVDGQEREVPYSRVQATMQKHEAADRRLQHASELLRRAEEREREAQERASRLAETASRSPQGTVDDEDLDKQAHSIINKLLEGEADSAANDLASILKGRRAPQIDTAEVETRAAKRALSAIEQAEWARDADSGRQRFVAEYPEIINDPDLAHIANQKTIDIMKEKPYLKPSEVLKAAGEYVMGRFFAQQRREQVTPNNQEREERKSKLKPIPRAANARQSPAPERQPQTRQDWLEEQRKRRGQRY